jgi:tetratricopeptide (TPR) repeat protein
MSLRISIALLMLAPLLLAADPLRDAYKEAKTLRGQAKEIYAMDQAQKLAGQASGAGYMYLGFLWQYAGEDSKAADAFKRYVDQADAKSKNRPKVMLYWVRALLEARRYSDTPAACQEYLQQYPAGDVLLQLGRVGEAKASARASSDGSGRYTTLLKAIDNIGKPWPNLPFHYWTGKDFSNAEVREKPVIWAFWNTKTGNVKRKIHNACNHWSELYGGKVLVAGPTLYYGFDPVNMRTEEDMTEDEEWRFIESCKDQYELKYPLCTLREPTLHDFCGVAVDRPTLPVFAVGDGKGIFRYVRVGGGAWDIEAVEAVVNRTLKQ